MGKKLYVLFVLSFVSLCMFGQNTTIKGFVKDSVSGEPLPYVSILFVGTTSGTTTNESGQFSYSVKTSSNEVEFSYMGYHTKKVKVVKGKTNTLNILLASTDIALNEVVIKPKKEHYKKKDNPAVAFVKKMIESRDSNSPRNHDFYSYDEYEKITFGMDDYQPKQKANGKKSKFDFLTDFVDTLETGTTVLPLSEKERMMTVYYRKDPKSEKQLLRANQSAGIDEILSRDEVQKFLNEVFREIDIFQNNIPLFLQRFVSPLSRIGPDYYKYYLLDTVEVAGVKCQDLGFVPFNSETFGFTGHLFVALDSTYFVEKVIMNVPKDINLNFVHGMRIEQRFKRTEDGTRLKMKDDIAVNFKITEKSKGMMARRMTVYSNHSFDAPDEQVMNYFSNDAPVIVEKFAYNRDKEYWRENRPSEGVKKNPNTVAAMMAKFRAIPVFHLTEQIVSVLVNGYIPTNTIPEKNKFEIGPMNTLISGNSIEGARIRTGGTTTTTFNKRWTLEGYAAYGTKDREWKYDGIVEYSFIDKKQYRKEFPVHSIRAEYQYDINQLGQHYLYTNKDNVFLSWKRQKDTRATYLRKAELTYTNEHYNGISYYAVLRNKREYSTPFTEFNKIGADGSIQPLKHYDMSEIELNFRYAYNEKFYQTRDIRYPITFDALIFSVNHIMAKKGLLGSSYNYQRTEIGIQKRFWFSAFGYVDLITKAGKVWSKAPYPLLFLPNANLSYTVQPESYTNMNAMEFLSDEYASWDFTYYMNGNLLNRLPLIKKLKWREVFAFRGLWGHLTDKNNPAIDPEGLYQFPENSFTLGKEPYMEASVGIENIFKFLRLDYVWRLNYRDNPGIQERGIRFRMKMSF